MILEYAARYWNRLEQLPGVGNSLRNLRYPVKKVLYHFQTKSQARWDERRCS